jgi:hypothetical protein
MKTILINHPQNTKYPQPPPGLAMLSEREIANKVKGADVIGNMEVRSCNKELIFKEKRYVVNEI